MIYIAGQKEKDRQEAAVVKEQHVAMLAEITQAKADCAADVVSATNASALADLRSVVLRMLSRENEMLLREEKRMKVLKHLCRDVE